MNLTLPAIEVSGNNWREITAHYDQTAKNTLKRIVALQAPGVVLEFELLPAMTENPEWGAELTALLRRQLGETHTRCGIPCALRVTPTDIREKGKPPRLRSGEGWERLKRSFELTIQAGADIVSIESIGGKEVHDGALLNGRGPPISAPSSVSLNFRQPVDCPPKAPRRIDRSAARFIINYNFRCARYLVRLASPCGPKAS